ncbi:type I restriction endonuclease subunit R [Bacteroides sp. GD17]|jgi:hypothetical protein|uniref:type I restriction endonuclease subunit R n=1 Tax=Bacteroides sp. GD17 TaxID=3139826 RepID=UPI0025CF957B|nr:type I restriction endonuclease subunit R [uncultured Bacteroides sp.]
MKFEQYTWNLYKQLPDGQKVIKEFADAAENMSEYDLFVKYNSAFAKFISESDFKEACEAIFCYGISEYRNPNNAQEAKALYNNLITLGIKVEGESYINHGDYQLMLQANSVISFLLYYYAPEYFFPNLFVCRQFDLNKIADTFEIELPSMPKKSDYRARCVYYWQLCEVFYQFRIENNLSPAELCAFLYDFAHNYTSKEITNIPKPAQSWFIGGLISPEEQSLNSSFWQANPETRKGDILVHYETFPISAITCIWIAQTDGVVDPFFHYYSNTYISGKIEIPHITLKELQADEYFSKHPLIRKKFQGVNGWPMSSEDYSELIRMIEDKGFDTEALPKLYAPTLPQNVNIELEHDVEKLLLEPLLNAMGLHENKDFIRQLSLKAGRGHRIFPDYILHYNGKEDDIKANVLIEAKLYMKNNQEIEEAFLQARSYARLLESSVIVLCDKFYLFVYEKMQGFDRSRYRRYAWSDMETSDLFNELKNKLNI